MVQPRRINLDEQAKTLSCTTPIIADRSVTSIKLATGAVDSNALGLNSVTSIKLHSSVYGLGLIPNVTTQAIDINVDDVTLQIVSDVLKTKSLILENFTSDPAAGHPGRLIWRTDLSQVRVDDGTAFSNLSGGHIIEDEGTPLTQRAVLNFVGEGVMVTDNGTDTVVTIPGGSASESYAQNSFIVTDILTHSFTLSHAPISRSEKVTMNGLGLTEGAGNDYTLSGAIITLVAGITLTVDDQITVIYEY